MTQATPSRDAQVAVPPEAYAFGGTDRDYVRTDAIPGIVAAELERISLVFDEVSTEYDRQSEDPKRDRILNLTGKAIGYERAARDLRLRAQLLRGDT